MLDGSRLVTFFAFLPIGLHVAFIIFVIYFVIKIIKFMDAKTKLDQERNEKLDEILKFVNYEYSRK
ncbi:hypothetical protein BHU72_12095 [Desulfuribacillus stibiiarsenatis]|uniref:DUF4083 domain-containing protein n=1 Tax=Desulfuribacillus stibiiarsenatis TaxID=1390249 RepID=A0A1E5L274_9FIRM|nr:hypothetical protein [Desulfuribacillus stibiiarsenatis]OEH84141.1 hypothetical protein BHU72_12095 [Desulfuribacillus stibiiarsenatis]